ncbi:RDD family protein [Candidatus Microgenomates bacterium CPR3]|nr:RDD family protein [Candidatus Microgenomates bacterium CPR3]
MGEVAAVEEVHPLVRANDGEIGFADVEAGAVGEFGVVDDLSIETDGHAPFGSAQGMPGAYGYTPPPYLPTECFGGFWIRFAASFMDGLILGIPLQVLQVALRLAFGLPAIAQASLGSTPTAAQASAELSVSMIVNVVWILSYWMYFALMHSKKGATLGKLAVGVRVVDQHGMYPGFGQATGRYFATILSSCGLMLGYIWAGFHPQKRTWHDSLANTWCVRKEYVNPAQAQISQG